MGKSDAFGKLRSVVELHEQLSKRVRRSSESLKTGRNYWMSSMLTLLISFLYVATKPASTDLMAQHFRAWLFQEHGFTLWNNSWFGGHTTFTYSVFAPVITGTIGVYYAGALAATLSAVFFCQIVAKNSPKSSAAAWWFAATIGVHLWTGRTTFALGIMFALATWVSIKKHHAFLSGCLAFITMFTSPVAGLFLILLSATFITAALLQKETKIFRSPEIRPWVSSIVSSSFGLLLIKIFSPSGTYQPFVVSAFLPSFLITLWLLASYRRQYRSPYFIGVSFFACLLAFAFVIHTPVGGNATRVVELFLGPMLLLTQPLKQKGKARTAGVTILLVIAGYWATYQPVRSWYQAHHDPASREEFYAPLLAFLEKQQQTVGPFRVEIVPTHSQGEAFFIAKTFPLARGWERQTDRKYSSLLYRNHVTAEAYRTWLDLYQVRYIALPLHTKLDEGAHAEAALLKQNLVFAQPVWKTENWQVWELQDHRKEQLKPQFTKITATSVEMTVPQPAAFSLGLRYSPLWQANHANVCIENFHGWVRLHAKRAGVVKLYLSKNPFKLLQQRHC